MCGCSKHSTNWTKFRPSLPSSYTLFSNVLALFPHCPRPIKINKKKLDDIGVSVLWFCAYLCECTHSFYVFQRGWGNADVLVYLTTDIFLLLSMSSSCLFVFGQNKIYFWQRWLNMRAHLSKAPGNLYNTSKSKCGGGWLRVVTPVVISAVWDLPSTHHQLQ